MVGGVDKNTFQKIRSTGGGGTEIQKRELQKETKEKEQYGGVGGIERVLDKIISCRNKEKYSVLHKPHDILFYLRKQRGGYQHSSPMRLGLHSAVGEFTNVSHHKHVCVPLFGNSLVFQGPVHPQHNKLEDKLIHKHVDDLHFDIRRHVC